MKTRSQIEDFSDCWENLLFLLNSLKRKDNCCHCSLFREIVELLKHMKYGGKPYIGQYSIIKIHLYVKITRVLNGLKEAYEIDAVIQYPKQLYDVIDNIQEFIAFADYHYFMEGNVAISDDNELYVIHEEQECGFWINSIRIK